MPYSGFKYQSKGIVNKTHTQRAKNGIEFNMNLSTVCTPSTIMSI